MVSAAVKKEAARGRALLETYAQQLFQQQLDRRDARKREALSGLFPSCEPGGRGACSPLGGTAEFPWGPKRKGD
jgi:hypothetical protein